MFKEELVKGSLDSFRTLSLSSDFAEDPAKCSQIVWMLATLGPVLRTPIVLEARCTPIRLRAPADRFAVCA